MSGYAALADPFFCLPAPLAATQREASLLSPILAQVMTFDPSLPSVATSGQYMSPAYAVQASHDVLSGGFVLTGPSSGQAVALSGAFYTGEITFPDTSMLEPSPSTIGHVYRPVAPCTQQTVEFWLQPCVVQRKTVYRCTWPNCTATLPLTTKVKARAHVHKHLGITKLYECSCGVQFACLDSAKRHANTQDKTFACQFCLKHFARKDHRGAHQRKCRYRVSA